MDGRAKLPPSARDKMPPLSQRFVAARAELLDRCRATAADSTGADRRADGSHQRRLRIGDEASAVPVRRAGGADEPPEIQAAAIATLGRLGGPAVAQALIDAWPRLSPGLRSAALDVLLSRPAWSAAPLTARWRAKRWPPRKSIRARIKLLSDLPTASSARHLRCRGWLPGSQPGRGRKCWPRIGQRRICRPLPSAAGPHFAKLCAACHRLENAGFEVGPSLAAIKNRGPEAILLAVLDPNREVNPQYVNYLAVLNDGRTLSGIIAAESATSITLRRTEGASDVVPRPSWKSCAAPGSRSCPRAWKSNSRTRIWRI